MPGIKQAEIVLGIGIILFSSFMVPISGDAFVLAHALAIFVCVAETMLRSGDSLLRRLGTAAGFRSSAFAPVTVGVHLGDGKLLEEAQCPAGRLSKYHSPANRYKGSQSVCCERNLFGGFPFS